MDPLSQRTDEELCALVRGGDIAAEECLAVRYGRLVRACARPYFLVGGDGEDLIQEGMIGLLTAIREFDARSGTPFCSYAATCIRSRLYSAIRAASREKHIPLNQSVSLDAKVLEADENLPYAESMEDALIDREESLYRLKALSKELSKFESTVLERYLEGLSYLQIADLTGKPLKSIDNAVQRIRRKALAYLTSGDNSVS